ncbi:MAG: ssDNA-binding domain-containing protein [Clostridiaceae bacterium]|jgi:antirestriction protein ArdC|nr:ssDNA-binding domain-containing protein [Clostridiaceae bacterium]
MSNDDFDRLSPASKQLAERILNNLDNGYLLWQKPWRGGAHGNPITGTKYQGKNSLELAMTATERGYEDPRWLTFNQMQAKGWRFKGDARGQGVKIWFEALMDKATGKPFNREEYDKLPKEERTEYWRKNIQHVSNPSTVFNASLIDGIEPYAPKPEDVAARNAKAERIIANSAAPVSYDGGDLAYYDISGDSIHLPPRASFKSASDFYGTGLHEIAHSTGHRDRLNRDMFGDFGSANYATEELRAEFASAFMQIELGCGMDDKHVKNHTAYIQSWRDTVRAKPAVLIEAIKDASEISAYVLDGKAVRAADGDVELSPVRADTTAQEPTAKSGSTVTTAEGAQSRQKYTKEQATAYVESIRNKRYDALQANVPPEMKVLPNWCAFKAYRQNPDEKHKTTWYKKSIYDCNRENFKYASCSDPNTWTTFEHALVYARENGCEGLSFALPPNGNIFCVDLDHCLQTDASGVKKFSQLSWDIVNAAEGTYCERSVSREGKHIFGKLLYRRPYVRTSVRFLFVAIDFICRWLYNIRKR